MLELAKGAPSSLEDSDCSPAMHECMPFWFWMEDVDDDWHHLNRAVLRFKSPITNLPHRYRSGSGNSFPLGSESCTFCMPIQASNTQYTKVRVS